MTGPEHAAGPSQFRFGPRDRRGLVGLRTAQLLLIAVALVGAVLALRAGGRLGAAVAVVLPLAALAAGWLPLAGRTPEQWLPIVVAYVWRRVAGCACGATGAVPAVVALGGGEQIGAVWDRAQGTLSAVVSVEGGEFDLLDAAEQCRRVSAWSGVLAASASDSGVLHRLQWIERTVPADTLADAVPFVTGPSQPRSEALSSYAGLVHAARGGLVHERLLVVTIRSRRGGRAGVSPHDEAALCAEVAAFARRCREAGIADPHPLDADSLAGVVRRAMARTSSRLFAGVARWPTATCLRWSAVQAGSLWHRSYWIAEWPRHDVGADFLLPLLLVDDDRRAVSVVMAPVPAARAVRAAEQARTAKAADAALRGRHGFAVTARVRREEEAVQRREVELAAGHAGYRFSGYVTVSAPSRPELDSSCRRVEQGAALAHLALVPLDGAHDVALFLTLPTGRGVR